MNKFLVLILILALFNFCHNKEKRKIYPSNKMLLYSEGDKDLIFVNNNKIDNYSVNVSNEDYYKKFKLLNSNKIVGEYVRRMPYRPTGDYIKYKDSYEIHMYDINGGRLILTDTVELDFKPLDWGKVKNDNLIFSTMIDSINGYPNKVATVNIVTRKTNYKKLFKDKEEYLDGPLWMSSLAISNNNEALFSYKNVFYLYNFKEDTIQEIDGIKGRVAYFSPNYEEFIFTNNDSLFIYNFNARENKFIYTIKNKSRDQLNGGVFMQDSNKIYVEYIENKDHKVLTKFRNFVIDKNTKEVIREGNGNFASFDLKYN